MIEIPVKLTREERDKNLGWGRNDLINIGKIKVDNVLGRVDIQVESTKPGITPPIQLVLTPEAWGQLKTAVEKVLEET